MHNLDGPAHRVRKAMFMALLTGGGIDALVARTEVAWDEAARGWAERRSVVLLDVTADLLTRAVCDWTGVPVSDAEVPGLAADLVALVDGFATAGPPPLAGPARPNPALGPGWPAWSSGYAGARPRFPPVPRSARSPPTGTPTAASSIRVPRRWSCSTSSGRRSR